MYSQDLLYFLLIFARNQAEDHIFNRDATLFANIWKVKSYRFSFSILFFISLSLAVGREEESAGIIGADMQSNRSGFAYETADIAPGEELEGNKHRHEREIASGRETGAQHARQSDGRQVAGVQAVRGQCRDEEDLGRG